MGSTAINAASAEVSPSAEPFHPSFSHDHASASKDARRAAVWGCGHSTRQCQRSALGAAHIGQSGGVFLSQLPILDFQGEASRHRRRR